MTYRQRLLFFLQTDLQQVFIHDFTNVSVTLLNGATRIPLDQSECPTTDMGISSDDAMPTSATTSGSVTGEGHILKLDMPNKSAQELQKGSEFKGVRVSGVQSYSGSEFQGSRATRVRISGVQSYRGFRGPEFPPPRHFPPSLLSLHNTSHIYVHLMEISHLTTLSC